MFQHIGLTMFRMHGCTAE